MAKINDGGPAFSPPYGGHPDPAINDPEMQAQSGMTLRDYFAAKAMQAAATYPVAAEGFTFEERANWAYQQADAMLRAREQS